MRSKRGSAKLPADGDDSDRSAGASGGEPSYRRCAQAAWAQAVQWAHGYSAGSTPARAASEEAFAEWWAAGEGERGREALHGEAAPDAEVTDAGVRPAGGT
jgi:hypothetical protein